jgi:hypothetical protein
MLYVQLDIKSNFFFLLSFFLFFSNNKTCLYPKMTPHPINITPKQHYYGNPNLVIPTRQHCIRVKKLLNLGLHSTSIIYLKGKTEDTRDNTDVDLEFRQESHFFYLTG